MIKKVRKQRGMDWYDTTKIPSRIDKKKSVFDFEISDNYTNVDLLLEIESSSRIVLLLS